LNASRLRRVVVVAAALLAGAEAALAADVTPPLANLPAAPMVLSIVRLIGGLALVFAVFLGGLWLFRNWQRLVLRKRPVPRLNILEFKSLGHRHALYVVGYEQQRMLLASSPAGVSMLTSLPPAEPNSTEGIVMAQAEFATTLREAWNRKP